MPKCLFLIALLLIGFVWTATDVFRPVAPAAASDGERRACDKLMKAAEGLRRDLKTIDIVLDAAADAGNGEREHAYRLKKQAIQKELDSAMKSIRAAECVTP
jgi:hypothetical protein